MEPNTTNFAAFQNLELDPSNKYDRAISVRKSPGYMENLRQLQIFAAQYSPERIYRDFVKIYDVTEYNISSDTLALIAEASESYGDNGGDISYLFTMIYFAMLSEQRRRDTKLGKRVIRLAVYQALFDTLNSEEVTYYPPRKWWLIDAQCSQMGF
jgi:hypothetical protein